MKNKLRCDRLDKLNVPATTFVYLTCLLLAFPATAAGARSVPQQREVRRGMVVSAHPLASEAGLEMLRRGGNAVDAAVACAFALGVVEPYSSGLGGGGFMLVYLAGERRTRVLDYRERAPLAAKREMYVRDGRVVPGLSIEGHLAVAVPGTAAGLLLALEEHGSLGRAEVLAPAIRLAREGFPVTPLYRESSRRHLELLRRFPESSRIFLDHGKPPEEGAILRQAELARTLELIARHGPDGFYRGEVARAIVAEMKQGGGILALKDLATYRPVWREPVEGTYRGHRIQSMPLPSSGGAVLLEILNILEGYDLAALGQGSAAHAHLLIEAMRRAFADRAKFMGDPDFVANPLTGLISKTYAASHRRTILLDRATPSSVLSHGSPPEGNTTHLVTADAAGSLVSLTQTINTHFGSGVTVPGYGILLNNEMDDFSARPGVPNIYGLVGGEANAIAPGKIPLSSMSPTLLFRQAGEERKELTPFMALGSPGGPMIISTVLQVLINVIDFGMDIRQAIAAPRLHHQWLPDTVFSEPERLSSELRQALERMGHQLAERKSMGNAQGLIILGGRYTGAADPRGEGAVRAQGE